ncbi:MAG: Co2+/Mg2+ efflux protein ApaG [Bdellovibrionota bacterium]
MEIQNTPAPYVFETRGVKISVWPAFDEENTKRNNAIFVYSYTVKIENNGKDMVQLLNRHWIIRDAFGQVDEVKGPGVIGKQPILQPGENFEYTSFCPLKTPTGSMEGSFEMRDSLNQKFEAAIGRFELKSAMLQN